MRGFGERVRSGGRNFGGGFGGSRVRNRILGISRNGVGRFRDREHGGIGRFRVRFRRFRRNGYYRQGIVRIEPRSGGGFRSKVSDPCCCGFHATRGGTGSSSRGRSWSISTSATPTSPRRFQINGIHRHLCRSHRGRRRRDRPPPSPAPSKPRAPLLSPLPAAASASGTVEHRIVSTASAGAPAPPAAAAATASPAAAAAAAADAPTAAPAIPLNP